MASPAPAWELADQGFAPARYSGDEIARFVLERRLSLQATVRTGPDKPWAPLAASELGMGCPDLRFAYTAKLSKLEEARGVVAANHDMGSLLASSRRYRALPDYPKWGFFVPLLLDHPGPPFVVDAALFQLWPGTFVGTVVESRALRPDMYLHLYILAFNLSAGEQVHTLVPHGYKIPEDQKGALGFSLRPWRWDVHRIFVPVPPKPGTYDLEFRSTSGAAKAGTAIAATALTLGMFTYIPGHKGFKIAFQVLGSDTLQFLDEFEGSCVKVVSEEFDAQKVENAAGPRGPIPKAEFVNRFAQYLRYNPERTLDVLQEDKEGEKAFNRLYGRYMMQEYGGEVSIGAPDAAPPK